MSVGALGIDLYQITTLFAQASLGFLDEPQKPWGMSFFFRRLPHNRNYVVTAGLRSIVEYCKQLRITNEDWHTLSNHPMLKSLWNTAPGKQIEAFFKNIQGFVGEMEALPEGTLSFAGPAFLPDGKPAVILGKSLFAYTPLIQVKTQLPFAKLIETPFVSRLNYFSMVASKAARIVSAAQIDGVARPVLEFGQRRTHPEAAVDAAYAAYLAGCDATSNLAATQRYGIPSVGTMDHFAIQAMEQVGIPPMQTEGKFFAKFCELFQDNATLLVDTYDTFQGIQNAIKSSNRKLTGIRLDSHTTPDLVKVARALLDRLGVPHVKILASDRLDEWKVQELADAGTDGFGVGENITCSPDAATGVGVVGKLVLTADGKITMKVAGGSEKISLPGLLQVYRFSDHDLLTLQDEPAPHGGHALLKPIWQHQDLMDALPSLQESRAYVQKQLADLPQTLKGPDPLPQGHKDAWKLLISHRLYQNIHMLVEQAQNRWVPA